MNYIFSLGNMYNDIKGFSFYYFNFMDNIASTNLKPSIKRYIFSHETQI